MRAKSKQPSPLCTRTTFECKHRRLNEVHLLYALNAFITLIFQYISCKFLQRIVTYYVKKLLNIISLTLKVVSSVLFSAHTINTMVFRCINPASPINCLKLLATNERQLIKAILCIFVFSYIEIFKYMQQILWSVLTLLQEMLRFLHSPSTEEPTPLRSEKMFKIYSSGLYSSAEINYVIYCSIPQKFTVHEKLNMHGLHLYSLIKLQSCA